MFPDPRLRRLSFEYPGSAGAGPRQRSMYIFPFHLYKIVPNCFPRLLCCCSATKSCLFVTLCTIACQASLSFAISLSLPKLMFVELVMPSNHLILCQPLLSLPSIFPSFRVPPPPIVDESLLSHILFDIIRFFFFKKSQKLCYEMVSCHFNLHFPQLLQCNEAGCLQVFCPFFC